MTKKERAHQLSDSAVVERIPLACSDELTAVEFLEGMRWGGNPCCIHCGSVNVYKMIDAKTGQRNKRFLWRCRDCKQQYTVRIGTVYEESRIELRHWCYAFWRAATSKKGVAALELKRHCQISYRSALFMMTRIRFAMAGEPSSPKLSGTVEIDEVYMGARRPRHHGAAKAAGKIGRGTDRPIVFAAVERQGQIRRRIVPNVHGDTLKQAIREEIDRSARIISDELAAYKGVGKEFAGHETVRHATREYVRGDVHTNTVESSHALLRRSIIGIYHAVSREYLHRYLWHSDFLWNHRKLNDGERIIAMVKATEGKRITYRQAIAQ
jgi:transposase-like protein